MMGVGWAQQPAPQTPSPHKAGMEKKGRPSHKKKAPPPQSVKELPPQVMPPIPATLMNSAPVNPVVTMERGMLMIDAPNSTLSDVLNGVHKATGAAIEGVSPTERVAVKLGPGKPEQVLAALLRGTPYDYVILGSLGRQDVVTRVLLTQQNQAGGPSPTTNNVVQWQNPRENIQPPDSPPENAAPDEATISLPGVESEPDAPQPAQPSQSQPKTPEQLFQELQQSEQQRQPNR
jgi:hypothetical protein